MIDYTDPNPLQHFNNWFFKVKNEFPEIEVNAMTLSTIGVDDFPKNRVVLLKQFDWEGFLFFTNYKSEKGISIRKNNKVAISFDWRKANKIVHILGNAHKISTSTSEAYFESRPLGSRLGAWASEQSKEIKSREELDIALRFYENKFNDGAIPKPKHWGGYKVFPKIIEFKEFKGDKIASKTTYKLQDNLFWGVETHYKISDF